MTNLRLGRGTKTGVPVELTLDERRQGTYIIGTTGTGKSTLLKNIIYQDLHNDREHGLCVLDPHGDLVDELLELVPRSRKDDVVFINPRDYERPFGLNMLECDRNDPQQVRLVVSSTMGAFERLFSHSWGPRLEHVLRNALYTTLELKDSTLVELLLVLQEKEFREDLIKEINDPIISSFWKDFPKTDGARFELVSSTLNKISPFITDKSMRNIIGQSHSTIDIQKIMDEGKILFVNLSKGDLGEANSSLLGSIIVNQIMIAAFNRRSQALNERRPFHLIVDEFQNFATESFTILQSEARKYAVDVVVGHQFRDQLDDLNKGSTLNVGNLIVFRISGRDSYSLASQFDNTPPPPETRVEPIYQHIDFQGHDFMIEAKLNSGEGGLHHEVELPRRPYSDVEAEMANKLSILPNYQAWCRLIQIPEDKTQPQSLEECKIKTERLGVGEEDKGISEYIRNRSRNMAPRREDVEREILERLKFLKMIPDVKVSSAEKIDKNS